MRRALLGLLMALWAGLAQAQTATLVADQVRIEADQVLVAEGNVEVLYEGTRLRARQITYDRASDSLQIIGPIVLTDDQGNIILADQADLDADLQNGLLISARLVLNRQLQLAAATLARVGDRYTRLDNTVASSCEVCAENPTPTWEIRASEVIHDQQERQIYFKDARFRVLGVPIAYFPRLRVPDPTNERSNGFLIPSFRTTSNLGPGVRLPYFLTLGDHADVTLIPYISEKTRTLQLSYRQTFRFGDLQIQTALSDDNLTDLDERWYFFAQGRVDLPQDFTLSFDIQEVSDPAYLIDYGFSGEDRLTTAVGIDRVRRNELILLNFSEFDTLRDAELVIEDELPEYYGSFQYQRRVPVVGGELRFDIDADTLTRTSETDILGRDVDQISGGVHYTGSKVLTGGLLMRGDLGVSGAVYDIDQDSSFDSNTARITPSAAVEFRLPMQRSTARARHLLEPVAQIAWSETSGQDNPNEDSVLVEFDEGNLFALSRFPGTDRVEEGLRANLGLTYSRLGQRGDLLALTLGRVLRTSDVNDFVEGTGLDGATSDWLAAARYRIPEGLEVTNRAVFDDDFDFTKNEARLLYQGDRAVLGTSYIYLSQAPEENRPFDTHEVTFDAAYRFSRHWTGKFDTKYDFETDEASRARVGLEYQSECIKVDLSLSRRFTSSTSKDAITDFGFNVNLVGFGNSQTDRSFRKTCNG